MTTEHDLGVRARLALAVAGRECADLSRGVVGDVSTPMVPGERIRKARRVRLMSLSVVDRAVLTELSEGATWEVVADALGMSVAEAERVHGPTWRRWLAGDLDDEADFGDYGVGLRGDLDLAGTAESLDAWHHRHREPWDGDDAERPVARVLVDGKHPAADDGESI